MNLKDEGEGKREMSESERERALVRVLSGEEELAELDVPKVSEKPGSRFDGTWEVGLHHATAPGIR